MDEGVKIEHGPGGSVYLKSNREYMQDKFKSVDEKIEGLEKRVGLLEAALAKEKVEDKNPDAVKTAEQKDSNKENTGIGTQNGAPGGKRVLVT